MNNKLTKIRNKKHIQYLTEELQIAHLKKDGHLIQYIPNPSEIAQLTAIENDSSSLKYIKNPSEAVQLEAVSRNGYMIEFIPNPSEQVQLMAVTRNMTSISLINNPNSKVQAMAIQNINDPFIANTFMIYGFDKINDPLVLLNLYKKTNDSRIKKSKHWKDDANLIIEVINE